MRDYLKLIGGALFVGILGVTGCSRQSNSHRSEDSEPSSNLKNVVVDAFIRTAGGDTIHLSATPVKVVDENALKEALVPILPFITKSHGIPVSSYDAFFGALRSQEPFRDDVTDGEGRIEFTGLSRKHFLVVRDSRRTGLENEDYLWVAPVMEARQNRILIGNHNEGGIHALDVLLTNCETIRGLDKQVGFSEQEAAFKVSSIALKADRFSNKFIINSRFDLLLGTESPVNLTAWKWPQMEDLQVPRKGTVTAFDFSPDGSVVWRIARPKCNVGARITPSPQL